MKKADARILRDKEQQIEEELVLKEEKVYVPKDKELKNEIMLYYNMLVAGHRGRWKIIELVTRNYQWLGVTKNVEKYVNRCNLCQRMKNRTEALAENLMANQMSEKPWTNLIVDFIMKLPQVAEKYVILIVFNRLSKMVHFVATTKETFMEGLVRLFRDNLQKLYGLQNRSS